MKLISNTMFASVALFSVVAGSNALAAEFKTYSDAEFSAAQSQGRPILIDVAAEWCSTCKAQAPIVRAIAAKPEYADLVVLRVDYDTQKAAVTAFRVTKQSTLITYRGRIEKGRALGIKDPIAIEALMQTALNASR